MASIGSTISAANAAAATQTTGVLAAAEDEVSAAISVVFSAHGAGFQALGVQAAVFHEQFVQAVTAAGNAYTAAEAANAGLLQPLQSLGEAASAPAQGLSDLLANSALSVSGVTVFQTGSARAVSGTGRCVHRWRQQQRQRRGHRLLR